ncbi:hypothetical protein GA0115260_1019115 [Streptomyces sp. MnatMP-M27]|nr:hypothetical protein GA0115260_1019115 [Streptomyces sp. MnatMP-M27]
MTAADRIRAPGHRVGKSAVRWLTGARPCRGHTYWGTITTGHAERWSAAWLTRPSCNPV